MPLPFCFDRLYNCKIYLNLISTQSNVIIVCTYLLDTEAKTKWQNLRSNYMREKRKVTNAASGSAVESTKISWPYYCMMSFLDESLKHKKTVGNVPEMDTDIETAMPTISPEAGNEAHDIINDDCGNNEGRDSEFISETNNSICGNIAAVAPKTTNIRKKRKQNPTNDDDIDIMYLQHLKQIASASEEANDPDLMFLKSLLPSIKKLGPLENLEFKGEVIQLLKNKLTPAPAYFSNPSSVSSCSYEHYPQQAAGHSVEYTDNQPQLPSNSENNSSFVVGKNVYNII